MSHPLRIVILVLSRAVLTQPVFLAVALVP